MTKTSSKVPVDLAHLLQQLQEWCQADFDPVAQGKIQFLRRVWEHRGGPPVIHAYGQAYADDEEGSFRWYGKDHTGRPLQGPVKYTDSQAADDPSSKSISDVTLELSKSEPTAPRDCAETVHNAEAEIDARVNALREWMVQDPDAASEFIVCELCEPALAAGWRNTLVYAAENVHFKDPKQQAKIRSRLRELALELRESSRAGAEHVVWSAMRRFSSLMPPEEANDLLEFLDRKGVVDTRMVALQCVARVFQAGPPSDTTAFEPLVRRVAEYADKFLDRDVFAGGQNSSIARNAILALAALGSPKLEGCVARLNALGRRWLSRQVRRQLKELLDGRKSHNRGPESGPAFEVVERVLNALQTAEAG